MQPMVEEQELLLLQRHIILSAVQPETVANRLDNKDNYIIEDKMGKYINNSKDNNINSNIVRLVLVKEQFANHY